MELTKTAQKVLAERYLIKDEAGVPIETPNELFHRVATVVAKAEDAYAEGASAKWVDKFEKLMTSMRFLPNTPTLINAGRPLGQLSACFVLPVEDSMRGIFGAVTNAALIHQSGGGTGFSFSRVRPKGAKVSTTQGKASGPLSFMKVFNSATDCVKQGGTRRGANMGCLRGDHPDILEFIDCKLNLEEFNNFNLSVLITKDFMKALKHSWIETEEAKKLIASAGEDFLVQVPKEYSVDANAHAFAYPLVHNGKLYGLLDSRYVWQKIVHNAWAMGEPGIVFIDRINDYNPAKDIEQVESTNPCLAGYTLILTKDGIFPIQELAGKEVEVWDGEAWTKSTPQITGENKELLRISFSNGLSVDCTPEHMWPICVSHSCPGSLPDGGSWKKIPAKEVRYGNWVKQYSDTGEFTGYCTVTEVKPWRIVDKVYCMTVPTTHCFVANGVLTGNCGEQPLLPYESCNLGSINLAKFVTRGKKSIRVDMKALAQTARLATRFLDNVIDVNKYPLPEIEEKTKRYRKIGLGVMGWADALYLLGIPYESKDAIKLAESVMRCIATNSVKASIELAKERGEFPAYEQVANNMRGLFGVTEPIRNMTTTTIAPTGTLSIIAGVSSGIEPVFAPVMKRRILDDKEFIEVDKAFETVLDEWLSEEGFDSERKLEEYRQDIYEYIIERGTSHGILPDWLADTLCCTKDISAEGHIQMQAAFQKHTHNAISKTVNLDNSASEEDVAEVYRLAYDLGCKGVTVYRDGSRYNQVMNVAKAKVADKSADGNSAEDKDKPTEEAAVQECEGQNAEPQISDSVSQDPSLHGSVSQDRVSQDFVPIQSEQGYIIPRDREKSLRGETTQIRTGCGKLYITINRDKHGVAEIFTETGKGGGCPSQSEAVGRLASIALRAGVDPQEIIKQLRGIRCPSAIKRANAECTSCPDAIAKLLQAAYSEKSQQKITGATQVAIEQVFSRCDTCPSSYTGVHTCSKCSPECKGVEPSTSSRDLKSKSSRVTESSAREVQVSQGEESEEDTCECCGEPMTHEGGCKICYNCGNSHCG